MKSGAFFAGLTALLLAACSDSASHDAWDKRQVANRYHPPGGNCELLTGSRFCDALPTGNVGTTDTIGGGNPTLKGK